MNSTITITGLTGTPYIVSTDALQALDTDLKRRIQFARVRYQQNDEFLKTVSNVHRAKLGRLKMNDSVKVKLGDSLKGLALYLAAKKARASHAHELIALVPLRRKVHAIWDQRVNSSNTQWPTASLHEYVLDVLIRKKSRAGLDYLENNGNLETGMRDAIQALVETNSAVFGTIAATQSPSAEPAHKAPVQNARQKLFAKICASNTLSSREVSLLTSVFG